MNGDKQLRSTLHICTLPEQPDVFLVVTDDSEPGAVPVIPTAVAESSGHTRQWSTRRRIRKNARQTEPPPPGQAGRPEEIGGSRV